MPAPQISRQRVWERLGYTPRIGQAALAKAVDAGHRYLSFFAFPRAGKSFVAAKIITPELLKPDTHAWVVAPTYELGSKEFGYVWNDLIELGWLQMASSRHFDKRGGNMTVEFPWGSFIRVVSADNPMALRAEELDWIILAEASALSQDIFYNHLFARVEKRHGRVLIPTTPRGFNWIYETFRVPSLKPGHKDLHGQGNSKYDSGFWSIVVSSVPEYGDILEPGIYDEETIERARRTMPLPFFKEQFGGDFSSYAGAIYPWDPRTMLVDNFKIPDDWTHIIGWDHGTRDINPTAVMIGSYDRTGCLYWWGEVYEGAKAVKDYWRKAHYMLGNKSFRVISTDPSANQVRIELSQIGVPSTYPQEKHIDARIIRTTQMMLDGKWKILRGRCPNLEREVNSWEWDEKNPGKPRPGQPCHALDACGYASLIPVSQESEQADPLAPPDESPETRRLWRGVRKKFQEQEEAREAAEFESALISNPFEEVLFVEDHNFYDPGL